MKIIDEKGRLLGKINMIDFLVVLFLLYLIPIFYYGYKIFDKQASLETEKEMQDIVDGIPIPLPEKDIEEILSDNQRLLDSIETKVDNLRAKVNTLEAKVNNLGVKVNNFGTTVNNLGTTVNNLGAKVNNFGTTVNNLENKVNRLQEKQKKGERKKFIFWQKNTN